MLSEKKAEKNKFFLFFGCEFGIMITDKSQWLFLALTFYEGGTETVQSPPRGAACRERIGCGSMAFFRLLLAKRIRIVAKRPDVSIL